MKAYLDCNNRVRGFREKRGFTQFQLANKVLCREGLISDIEQGLIPSVFVALLIASALECKVEDIFFLEITT